VREQRFREDLFFRLKVVPIAVPPLRERRGDIPELIRHFLAKINTEMGTDIGGIALEAEELLLHHPWPGNVRELENCLVRAVVLARGGVIRPDHLTLGASANGHDAPFHSLDDAERDHIARVFAATGRQKAKTAEILGVSRPRLDRLLRKHGLA
jgi:two-component system response regulator AtoC